MAPTADEPTDEQLLAAAAAGSVSAFDAFYRRYQGPLLAYFARRTAGREQAFDLMAETFAAVVASIDSFDATRGKPAGWVFGIAANKLRESTRRGQVEDAARRRLELERVELDDHDLRRIDELAGDWNESRLAALLNQLPTTQREALLARVVAERPYPEIAAALDCSEAVVRQRVRRGLSFLRTRLEATR